MIRINCPICGLRDHSEFAYGGDAAIEYPPIDAPLTDWHSAVFLRENIHGVQLETWQHVYGCRMWLIVERNNIIHQIHSVRLAHEGVREMIEKKR